MKINPSKGKAVPFTRTLVKEPAKLYIRGSINSESEQLQILGNNLAQRLQLG